MSLIYVAAGPDSPWLHRVPSLVGSPHTFRIFSDTGRLLSAVRDACPSALVVASQLPTPADLDLVRSLDQACSGLPILLASDHLTPDSAVRCARAGVTHVISDSLSNNEFMERLNQAIVEERERTNAIQEATPGLVPQESIKTLREVIHNHLTLTLAACQGNRSLAAKLLGIDRSTLRRRLAETEATTSQ